MVGTGTSFTTPQLAQTTTYYVQEVSAAGCESNLVAVMAVVNPPATAPTTAPITVCDGDDVILSATGNGVGDIVFYNSAGVEIGRGTMSVANTTITLNIGPLAVGTYSYAASIDDGACASALVGINVSVIAAPATPAVFNDGPACAGETVFLQAGPVQGATYNWTGPNGFASNLQTVMLQNVSAATAGTYTVNVTIGSCTSADTTTIVVVNALPNIDTIGNNGPLCQGDVLNLTGPTTANVSYLWTGPNGFSSTIQNPSLFGVDESNNQGFYGLVITDNTTGCQSAMSSTLVMITSLPAAGLALNSGPVCQGDSVNLMVASVFGASYSWTGPNGFSSTNRTPTVYNMDSTRAGIYTVDVSVNGCSTTLTTNVQVRTALFTSVTPDTTIELGVPLQLVATGGVLFEWSPPTFLSSTTTATPILTATQTGTFIYSVRITDAQGCSASEKLTVTVIPSNNVLIPDLYTPNADGVNDTWEVDFLQPLSNYTVRIFSRGGLEVWNTTNYQNDWNGTHYKTGKILPDGTYYYMIMLADGTEFKGPVTIKR